MNKETDPIDQDIAPVKTLFKPGSWFAKIDFINHLILFNNVIITVLSEKEGGKTSFSTLLQNNLDQQIKFHAITALPACARDQVIQELAKLLNVNEPNPNMASLVAHINADKSHMLIIVDDAHCLPDDFIQEALEVIKKQDDFGFFHFCFISDHSIVSRLNKLSINPLNDLIHTIELSSLNENETRTYVLQRLMTNKSIKKAPTDLEFKQFYQLTKGNMSKINHKFDSFILNCSQKSQIKKIHWIQGAGVLISAIFVLKATFWHFSNHTPTDTQANSGRVLARKKMQVSSVMPAIRMPLEESKLVPVPLMPWLETVDNNSKIPILPKFGELSAESMDPSDKSRLVKIGINGLQTLVTPGASVSQIPSWQDGARSIELVQFELPNHRVKDDLDEEQKNTTIALVDKLIVIPKLKPFDKSAINPYTIQLLASHNIKDIQYLRRRNPFLAKAQIRYFRNEKGLWYILILGQYKNKTDAQSHAKNLPLELARLNPWVRSMSGLENVG